MNEEKALKKQIKEKSIDLQNKTKDTIEGLNDNQILEILFVKWIVPMLEGLSEIPNSIISSFITKLDKLSNKYLITFSEVEEQIDETEKELSSMIKLLTGNEFDMKGLENLKGILA